MIVIIGKNWPQVRKYAVEYKISETQFTYVISGSQWPRVSTLLRGTEAVLLEWPEDAGFHFKQAMITRFRVSRPVAPPTRPVA
jgi:hypothetical protein